MGLNFWYCDHTAPRLGRKSQLFFFLGISSVFMSGLQLSNHLLVDIQGIEIQWKFHHKRGPPRPGSFDENVTAVIFDDPIGRTQSQPGPFTRFLGRKKRIEYPGQVLLRDAGSGI